MKFVMILLTPQTKYKLTLLFCIGLLVLPPIITHFIANYRNYFLMPPTMIIMKTPTKVPAPTGLTKNY